MNQVTQADVAGSYMPTEKTETKKTDVKKTKVEQDLGQVTESLWEE